VTFLEQILEKKYKPPYPGNFKGKKPLFLVPLSVKRAVEAKTRLIYSNDPS
jgi:hypothetical protein